MTGQNLHTHTTYSDGKNTMEECVEEALRRGFGSLGFSDHAFAPYDTEVCMEEGALPAYQEEFARLGERYRGRISLFLGLECDCWHPGPREGLDYSIGSVHYVEDQRGRRHPIDYRHADYAAAIAAVGGTARALVERYYGAVADMVRTQPHEIVGHLDLIGKLNGGNRYFDPAEGWYQRAAEHGVEAVAAAGRIAEVNTGGHFRGYTEEFYPSRRILCMLREQGVPVTVSSDAHSAQALDHAFPQACAVLREVGYRSIKLLGEAGFVDWEL